MRPEIGVDGWLIEAFFQLSTMRQIGMDVGPIPYDRIIWYAERHDLSDQFVHTIEHADRLYLAARAGKEEGGQGNDDP